MRAFAVALCFALALQASAAVDRQIPVTNKANNGTSIGTMTMQEMSPEQITQRATALESAGKKTVPEPGTLLNITSIVRWPSIIYGCPYWQVDCGVCLCVPAYVRSNAGERTREIGVILNDLLA